MYGIITFYSLVLLHLLQFVKISRFIYDDNADHTDNFFKVFYNYTLDPLSQ